MLMVGLYDNETQKEYEAVWMTADYLEWFWINFLKDMISFTPKLTIGGIKNDPTGNTLGKEKRQKAKKT